MCSSDLFPSHDILQMVKLEELHDRKPNQLSGGQQQRVAIARAVVNKPLVLLLDEPLSALDYSLRKEMQIELKRLQRRLNITFILVTHDQEEALSISDRVAVMEKGAIAQIGTPREIYETPKTLSVARFIGEANIFECVVLALTENKIQVSISGKSFWINNKIQATLHDKINVSLALNMSPHTLRLLTALSGLSMGLGFGILMSIHRHRGMLASH